MFIPFSALPLRLTSPYDRAPQPQPMPEPARVVGSLALLFEVLLGIAARPPETLSAAEADLQALFDGQTEDLLAIFDRAKEEMITATATAARAGVM